MCLSRLLGKSCSLGAMQTDHDPGYRNEKYRVEQQVMNHGYAATWMVWRWLVDLGRTIGSCH